LTSFRVSVPIQSLFERTSGGGDMTSSSAWLNDGPRLDGVRVLVVDDTRNVREAVTDILTHDGAKVTAVGSAEEALAALQRERPDVLLSDLAMPGKGGYWLIGQVRALPPERGGVTPAAALTAYTGPEHRASVLRAGFQLHLEKPISLDALIGVVAMLALKERALAPRS
jgi:CheY-like chemotaxis protein